MREIGSEFWDGCTPSGSSGIKPHFIKDFYTIETISGRTALDIVVRDIMANRKVHTVYMPSYCCHSFIDPFVLNGMHVKFYSVYYLDNKLVCDFDIRDDFEIILMMDYFGYIETTLAEWAQMFKESGKIVVYDATHSLLCNVDVSCFDYIFGSYRKWLNVNGGFCSKKQPYNIIPSLTSYDDYVSLRATAFSQKKQYMMKQFPDKDAFLQKFRMAESMLDDNYRNFVQDINSDNIICTADKDIIIEKRRKNRDFLVDWLLQHEELCDVMIDDTARSQDVPLFVPVLVKNKRRNMLKQFLIKHGIYCPVHWPLSNYHMAMANKEKRIYEDELSLICDQRYDEDDMNMITGVLDKFICYD